MIELTKAQIGRALKEFGYGKEIVPEKGTIERTNGGWLKLYLHDMAKDLHYIDSHYLARHSDFDLARTDWILKGVRANG